MAFVQRFVCDNSDISEGVIKEVCCFGKFCRSFAPNGRHTFSLEGILRSGCWTCAPYEPLRIAGFWIMVNYARVLTVRAPLENGKPRFCAVASFLSCHGLRIIFA
jgi:hypothetical protein